MSRLAAVLALATLSLGGAAAAYPVEAGTQELRPLLGVMAALDNQPTQVAAGLDYAYSFTSPLSLVVGGLSGLGGSQVSVLAHLGLRYRFLRVHPRLAPFATGGLGLTLGFPTGDAAKRDGDTRLGVGARLGGGVDFFATERVVPNLQLLVDLGARFAPSVAFQGSVQLSLGCAFLF